MLRDWKYSFLRLHELTYKRRNFIRFGIKSEVSCVENVNLSVRHIPAIGFGLRELEREVVLPPDHQQPRMFLSHPRLPLRVGIDVCAVVVEEVALNFGLARLVEKGK